MGVFVSKSSRPELVCILDDNLYQRTPNQSQTDLFLKKIRLDMSSDARQSCGQDED